MQNHNESLQHNTTMANHTEPNSLLKREKENAGLLTLVNEVKHLFDTKHTKKIEDLEFKLLEKEELISQMGLEISTLKAQHEEKDIEIYRMREEINESKRSLEQLVATLNRTQD